MTTGWSVFGSETPQETIDLGHDFGTSSNQTHNAPRWGKNDLDQAKKRPVNTRNALKRCPYDMTSWFCTHDYARNTQYTKGGGICPHSIASLLLQVNNLPKTIRTKYLRNRQFATGRKLAPKPIRSFNYKTVNKRHNLLTELNVERWS